MKEWSINTIIPADKLMNWQAWELRELAGACQTHGELCTDFMTPSAWIGDSCDPTLSCNGTEEKGESVSVNNETVGQQHALDDPIAATVQSSSLSYPTAAELETIHHEAWQTGYDAGFESAQVAGLAKGHAIGLAAGKAEARDTFAQCWAPLVTLAESFSEAISQLESQLSLDILKLSVTLAERLVADHVACEPNALLPVLREVLAQLPVTLAQGRIKVHPDDLAITRTFLEQEMPTTVWQWVEDTTLKRGGCIVETPQLKLDVSLASRLAVLKTALGLEPDHGAE